ncbi:MAG: enoyl-CoA hydratase/isomerase family protein [Hydrocarboniphaga sp.]|uniref:enoyl-CoA hydratase/isomerase family protein n=1 Tax=Hydrocarboniphaga sp. TaxID=2033016 RepID=UPI00262D56DB|nr:enoyl-CoA hydratase/isomerase family protein [Hydrocarboniphaga sp.]MDB5971148.1 enoyl-CoA hydratase/isomerase family protein [Hydrocarboniphaga sp.]
MQTGEVSSTVSGESGTNAGIRFELTDDIAIITLDRPSVGNVLDRPTLHALMLAAIRVDEDEAIRCVVLTGEGRLFCAGGDIPSFAAAGDRLPTLMKEITVYLNAAVSRLSRMNKPLVVAVNGAAAGAGLGLSLLGDIVIASERASFTTAYTAIGLSPDGGVSWMLPRLVGLRRAQEFALGNRKIGADEALSMGLVTSVVVHDALMPDALAAAQRLAKGSPSAVGALRTLFLSAFSETLETHLEMEARSISRMTASPEAKALAAQFAARRRTR